jgi:hypothetical protein
MGEATMNVEQLNIKKEKNLMMNLMNLDVSRRSSGKMTW